MISPYLHYSATDLEILFGVWCLWPPIRRFFALRGDLDQYSGHAFNILKAPEMQIDKKEQDFAAKRTQTFYACCCSCCCLMWIGGLIGAGIGAAATSHRLMAFREDPEKKALLSFVRKWYWSSLLLLSPLLLLLLVTSTRDENLAIIISACLPPAFNFFIAALVTSVVIAYKITDIELRNHINKRNWTIFGISLIGNVLGVLLVIPMVN